MAEHTNEPTEQVEEFDLSELLQIRRDKLSDLAAEGKDPFALTVFDQTHHAAEIIDRFDDLDGQTVRVAGRIMSKRDMGKAFFCDLRDKTGKIHMYIRVDDLG